MSKGGSSEEFSKMGEDTLIDLYEDQESSQGNPLDHLNSLQQLNPQARKKSEDLRFKLSLYKQMFLNNKQKKALLRPKKKQRGL